MGSFTVFELGFKGRKTARIEKTVVVDNGSEKERVVDGRVKSSI